MVKKKLKDTDPCAVCGKTRPPLAVRDQDPYCSAPCCRKAHGLNPAATTEKLKRGPVKDNQRTNLNRRGYPDWTERIL